MTGDGDAFDEAARWVGSDDDLEFTGFDADDDDFDIVDFGDVVTAIGLPGELAPLRLPPLPELAARARTTRLAGQLAAVVAWAGEDGRLTDADGDLADADAADGARSLGVEPADFAYLWEYALTADWLDFADEGSEDDEDSGEGDESLVVPGETAASWASGDDADVLLAWRKTMVSVLSSTLDVAADADPELAALLDFEGQGLAMAVMLFLARGEGLPVSDLSDMLLQSASPELGEDDGTDTADEWVQTQGDPALLILRKLADAAAAEPPDDGVVRLTPLGLWAVREELTDVGIDIPLLPARTADMTAAQLLLVAEDAERDEFEAESDAWIAARGPGQAASELLEIAAADGPGPRLLAVSVATRIGEAAEPAWRENLEVPQLRPYAKMALATLAEQASPGTVAPDLEPLPDDLAWVATDVLALACDDDEPDPDMIVESFRDAVPAGEESALFEMMSHGTHPDAIEVLQHIGRYHPDKNIASQARTAANQAASRRNLRS
jgi:hypothetical protein